MTATLIEDRVTPLTTEGLINALADGYSITMGSDPSPKCLSVLTAQACLETGNGKSLHCFNFGNVKAAADWDGCVCMYRCNEIIGGKVQWFDPPHPQTRFRAFLTAAEGAAEYVAFLATRERYRAAWSRAYAGDAEGFSRSLAKAGYYTANVESYTRGLVSIAARSFPACVRILADEHHGLTDEDREHIDGLVALTLSDAAFRRVEETEPFPLEAS